MKYMCVVLVYFYMYMYDTIMYTHMCILPPFFFKAWSIPTLFPAASLFFSAQGELHLFMSARRSFNSRISTSKDFGFSQQFDFSFLEKIRKDFQNLRMVFLFWEGRGVGRAHKKNCSRILATQKCLWCRMFWGQLFLHVAWCVISFPSL